MRDHRWLATRIDWLLAPRLPYCIHNVKVVFMRAALPASGGSKGAGLCPCPFWGEFFHKSEVYEQKISIKRVRNFSQHSGNGHFRDSNFHKLLGKHAPNPLESLRLRHLLLPSPFENPRSNVFSSLSKQRRGEGEFCLSLDSFPGYSFQLTIRVCTALNVWVNSSREHPPGKFNPGHSPCFWKNCSNARPRGQVFGKCPVPRFYYDGQMPGPTVHLINIQNY